MLEYLFAHGADLKNGQILTEIMEPVDADFGKACLRLFLKYGGSPDAISHDFSLLEWFASGDDLDTFELLLRSGANSGSRLRMGTRFRTRRQTGDTNASNMPCAPVYFGKQKLEIFSRSWLP